MNIVMASDSNYVDLLCTAITSLLENNKVAEQINIYLINDHISDAYINEIDTLIQRYQRNIFYLNPPVINANIQVKGNLNISTYYRLFLSELLPGDIDRVLYLDCDVIVRGDITELYNSKMNDCYVAGVLDTTGRYSRLSIGLNEEDDYVNAGILLINLAAWRSTHLQERYIEYISSMSWKVEYNDQGVINKVCNGKIQILPPKYNCMVPYQRYSADQIKTVMDRRINPYNEEEYLRAKNNPVIVHFAGYAFSRPWFEGANNKYSDEFKHYGEISGITCKKRQQPISVKYLVRKSVNYLPSGLCIWCNRTIDRVYQLQQEQTRKNQ